VVSGVKLTTCCC